MCGLVGAIAARGRVVDAGAVQQATSTLGNRGPDGEGFWSSEAAAFGHTRLSIIDLKHGDQPILNEDGSVITVFNGEIWNHESLRRELEAAGHSFRTGADTEVLVHGYEEWGDALLDRLDGMFAFAIWDDRRERLLLARDRIGKKPLYVAESAAGVVFGSTPRAVALAAGLTPEVDLGAVPEFLFQRYVCAPRTLLKGVEKLLPGHTLSYDRSGREDRPYWQIAPGDAGPLEASELRELLRDSVRRRLMSDVPIGVLLSGGVDSVAVLGLMREAGADSFSSFTIGFDDPIYDERPLARIAAARHGSDHHEMSVDSAAFIGSLPRLAWLRGEPIAQPTEIPLLLLAELAGRHVKVVLTGDGGDELFGGYPKYRAERLLLGGGPAMAAALRLAAGVRARRPSHRMLGRAAETLAIKDRTMRWASWFRSFSHLELDRILAPALQPTADDLTEPIRRALAPYGKLDAGTQMLVADTLTWLPDNMLLRGDNVLMAASVEGRMPLLDRALVERVSNVPASIRMSLRGRAKAVLRTAVGDLVPPEILAGEKRGFAVPIAEFLFRDPERTLERLVLSDRCLERGLYEPDEVRKLVEGEGSYGNGRDLKVFTVASLELWLRSHVDDLAGSAPEEGEPLDPVAA
jgi:asparagine synthase (glutamine-hydrolysing)